MKHALGIDLSAHVCGYAILNTAGTPVVHGIITTPEDASYWERQETVVSFLEVLLASHPVKVVVFEQVRQFHQGRINLAAIRDLSRLSGAIGLVAHRRGLEIVEVHTGHWRKRVLGDGRATKDDVVEWVVKKYGVKAKKPDEAEALCLARYGQIEGTTLQAKAGRANGKDRADRRREQPLDRSDHEHRERRRGNPDRSPRGHHRPVAGVRRGSGRSGLGGVPRGARA